MLLLDEPTNHLDIQVIEWLEKTLGAMRSALVLISHDRRFFRTCRAHRLGGPGQDTQHRYRLWQRSKPGAMRRSTQEELERHKLARKIEREADWLRYGVTARRKRNVRRLAEPFMQCARAKRECEARSGSAKIEAAEGPLSGKLVIEANGISKSFGGEPVVEKFSIRVIAATGSAWSGRMARARPRF